jgi:pyruvate formate lyase activating enzyme
MIIAGLQKTTLIDFQDKVSCIIFLAGCNFRCPWCYSAELVLPMKIARQPRISEQEIFEFLRSRKGLLDGVVLCGGEPTINKDLPQFIEKIKNLGFLVKLDTNGSNPEMLKDLVARKLIDYVAMDIKIAPESPVYKNLMIEGITIDKIKESVEFLKKGNVGFEFRTTTVNTVHTKEDFIKIANWIGGENVTYYLQNFVPTKTIDPEFEKITPFKKDFFDEVVKEISPKFKICQFRG